MTRATPDTDAVTGPQRRHFGRGWLAEEVDALCRKGGDEALTVHNLRSKITNADGEHPSTGAVSAVLQRWQEGGYCKLTKKPVAFNGFTKRYEDKSLAEFLEDQKTKRAKARAKAA